MSGVSLSTRKLNSDFILNNMSFLNEVYITTKIRLMSEGFFFFLNDNDNITDDQTTTAPTTTSNIQQEALRKELITSVLDPLLTA